MFIALGGSIGYWQGNVNTLVDDIGALKPSIFIGVPRVFDRIYNRVTDQVCLRRRRGHMLHDICWDGCCLFCMFDRSTIA